MEAPAERLGRVPFTLGHENAGWVEKLGPGATGFAPGDPVLVYGPWGCGTCANCRLGMENYCEATGGLGGGLAGNDGGMAPYLLVPATRFLIPLGSLDPREEVDQGRNTPEGGRQEHLLVECVLERRDDACPAGGDV